MIGGEDQLIGGLPPHLATSGVVEVKVDDEDVAQLAERRRRRRNRKPHQAIKILVAGENELETTLEKQRLAFEAETNNMEQELRRNELLIKQEEMALKITNLDRAFEVKVMKTDMIRSENERRAQEEKVELNLKFKQLELMMMKYQPKHT